MRSRGRSPATKLLLTAMALTEIVAGLLVANRAALTYATHRITSRLENYGFAATPTVTIEGFPFLTQLASRRLSAVDVSGTLRTGALRASVHGTGTGIVLGTGSTPTTVTQLTATGLIPFASLAQLTHTADVPGLQLSDAGPHTVTLRLSLGFFTLSGVASVSEPHGNAVTLRLLSTPSVPSLVRRLVPHSLVARYRQFTILLPPLPLGLTAQRVTLVQSGAVITVRAHDVKVPSGSP